MASQDPAFWEALLGQLLEPDTETINAATKQIVELLKSPQTIVAIFERLTNSARLEIRHHAALLVRRRIRTAWPDLPQNIQNGMKDALGNIILNQETPRIIRKASADTISAIASILLPELKWPDYYPFVAGLLQSDRTELREVGFQLLTQILDLVIDTDETKIIEKNFTFSDLTGFIGNGLQDKSLDVVIQAMSCMNTFIECIPLGEEVQIILQLLPPLTNGIKICIDDHDERVFVGFEVLNYVAEAHMGQITQLLPDLLVFTLNVSSNIDLPLSIRQQGIFFLENVITTKPKTFIKCNLLETTIQIAFQLMTEPEDDICGEDTGSRYGSQLIDSISATMPAHVIWPLIISRVESFSKHQNSEFRKAAINAISILSEGCVDEVEEHFDELMPLVLSGFSQENAVRQASCICIAEFSKNLPDEIIPYGEQLVPVLIQSMHDPNDLVRSKSCYALGECSSSLKEYIMPHIEPLLKRLVEMLTDPNIQVQQTAVGGLSAIVDMAEENIAPYFGPIIEVMKKWMMITDPEQICLRARATECVASLSQAQKEYFKPHFESCIQIILSGFQIDSSELRESIYGYCEHMSRLFTAELTPYVDGLIPYALATIQNMDIFLPDEDCQFTVDVGTQDFDGAKFGQMVDEKDNAISLIGWLAFHYCDIFKKYIPEVKSWLLKMMMFHTSPATASVATVAAVQLCSCVNTLVDPDQGWVQGVNSPLHPEVSSIINEILNQMVENIDGIDDIIVCNTLDSIGNLANAFGPSAIPQNKMIEIVNTMMSLLKREAPCQLVRESFDEGEYALFMATLDTISQFSRVYGKQFTATLEQFLMCLPPYLQPDQSNIYKNCIIATLAEVIQELKEAFAPYCPTFLPIAINFMENVSDKSMKHNACYCSGLLVEYGGVAVHQYLEQLCNAVGKIFTLDPVKYDTVIDNACGTIARMINAAPDKMPIDQVFPVVLNNLPLKSDFEPAIPIHKCIFNLLQAKHPVVNNQCQIACLFAQEILSASLPKEDLNAETFQFVKSVYPTYKQQIDGIMQNLVSQGNASPENATLLHQKLNG